MRRTPDHLIRRRARTRCTSSFDEGWVEVRRHAESHRTCPSPPGPFPLGHQRAVLLAETGRLEEAREAARSACAAGPHEPETMPIGIAILGLAGGERDAVALAGELVARSHEVAPDGDKDAATTGFVVL